MPPILHRNISFFSRKGRAFQILNRRFPVLNFLISFILPKRTSWILQCTEIEFEEFRHSNCGLVHLGVLSVVPVGVRPDTTNVYAELTGVLVVSGIKPIFDRFEVDWFCDDAEVFWVQDCVNRLEEWPTFWMVFQIFEYFVDFSIRFTARSPLFRFLFVLKEWLMLARNSFSHINVLDFQSTRTYPPFEHWLNLEPTGKYIVQSVCLRDRKFHYIQ
jgi:hypothetical protein